MRILFAVTLLSLLGGAWAQDEPGMAQQMKMMLDFGLITDPAETTPAGELQRVIYTGAPLAITLNVGRERRLVFDSPVQIRVEPDAAPYLAPEIYGNNLLLRVSAPLQTRIRIRLDDGQVIPMDVYAVSAGAADGAVAIVREAGGDAGDDEQLQVPRPTIPTAPGYIDLVRHAAQELYAPRRLRPDQHGFRDVDVDRTKEVRVLRYARLAVTPLAAWEQGGLYVTALRVRNRHQTVIDPDPRWTLGQFRAATFHHRRLAGGAETVLYLVSDQPFEQALGYHSVLQAHGGGD